MFLSVSHIFLQEYWWFIVSLLGSLLVFLLFVQGGQSFILTLPDSPLQKTMIVNAMGRKWEFTFTTLVTFGGAFFASFPLFYATSFGGAYWVWIAILFSFVIQAVAYEFRSRPGNVFGPRTFEGFLFINGVLGPFLLGTAVATFFTGARFALNDFNMVSWESGWHGLEALTSPRNISLGLTVLFLSRILGLMYMVNSIEDEDLDKRSRRRTLINAIPFLAAFLFFTVSLFVSDGFAVDPSTGTIYMEKYKYLHNLLDMPVLIVTLLSGVFLLLFALYKMIFTGSRKPVWCAGIGTVLTVLSLFLLAGYNSTSFYPSVYDLQSSLTIGNASSSYFTLKTMMYVSFFIPLVLVYIWYAWRAINRKAIDTDEISKASDTHIY